MKRKNLVLCGGLIWNGELCEVFCDPEVGELCFSEDMCGTMMIGELSVTDPITLPNINSLRVLLSQGNLIGAVYTKSGIYTILSPTVSELRPLSRALEPTGNTVMIDLDVEAEIEEDED